MRPHCERSARASAKLYPETTAVSAVLSTLNFGDDPLVSTGRSVCLVSPVSRPALASSSR